MSVFVERHDTLVTGVGPM